MGLKINQNMKKKNFLASSAKTVFALAAVVMMSSVFTACSKDNNDDDDAPVITATTSKAVDETINILFDKTDAAPEVEGLEKVKEEELTDMKSITYKVVSQTFRLKGELKRLQASYNPKLTQIEFTPSTKLTFLDVSDNQLSSLDVSMLPELTELCCDQNNLNVLRVARNPKLAKLSCYHNQLSRLDLSKNTALEKVFCHRNKLTGKNLKLPNVESGTLYFKGESEIDTQALTKDEVAAFKALGWSVKKVGSHYNWTGYDGE